MKLLKLKSMACCAFLCAAAPAFSGSFLDPLSAQAPPGPMTPTVPLPPPKPAPPPKKKPQIAPRKTIAGYWKLNTDESDNAKNRLDEARRTKAHSGNDPNGTGSPGGSGNPGSGTGRVGGIGFPPFPGGGGGNGPYGGNGRGGLGGGDTETAQKIYEIVRPDASQSISLMDTEVDSLNDRGDKLVFATDGRKIEKSKNDSLHEVPAHWDGQKLVTDEKGPQNKKMSRTIELSPDGRQVYETWSIENGKSGNPITIRYVYDAANEYDD
jgi:hypothetical protein